MAMTIATGFVVDDAIVVVENISRHLEAGMSPREASLLGAKEIGFTVLSISVSLVAVFIPILLMEGYIGRLFREFAVTLSVAIGVSMVVSLTTTPMMCAIMLKPHSEERHGPLFKFSEWIFDCIIGAYERTLRVVLRHQFITLLVTLGTIGFTGYLYVIVPKGLFPQQDTGRLTGNIQADQNISLHAMEPLLNRFASVILEDPGVESLTASIGGNGNASNASRMFITLRPLEERGINEKTGLYSTADDILGRLRPKLGKVPGGNLVLQAVQDLRIGARSSSALYQFTLQSDSLEDLQVWGPQLKQKMSKLEGLADVTSDQQNRGLQAGLSIDRLSSAIYGITSQSVDDTLYDAFGQRQVSTMYMPLNQYHVVLEVEPEFLHDPESLRHLYVRGRDSTEVPINAIARYKPSTTPLAVNHSGLIPSVTISFNLVAGTALGDAVERISELQREMGFPHSIRGSFQGTAQAFQASLRNQPLLILAALVTVYIVLGVLYESYIHPITILSTLPSAGVGALLALLLCKTELNVMALIGIILLIGIVKKNAIMMIDFALEAERTHGKSPEESIYEACVLRFRPITMTTMAALLGGLPLALGNGVGSELRRPMGIAIVGGLIFSQMLTLYTTPVVYLYLDRFRLWWAGHKRKPAVLPYEEVLVG
jgi:multidrug efflux pump